MKRIALLVLFLSTFIPFLSAATPQIWVSGSSSFERIRVVRLENTLNFTKEPMVSTWRIAILSGEQFRENTRKMNLDTDSAYTYLDGRTFINEDYMVYADDVRLRQTIAHEAGHLICQCASEQKANDIAYVLQFE